MTPDFISTPAAFDALCDRIGGASHLALDTEFVRVRTYFSVLCVIQVNAGDGVSCIDAIAIEDLSGLLRVTDSLPSALTIHAGRQDFEALYQRSGRLPSAVWDTQIAAAMLDLGDQVSYAQLVSSFAGVELAKGHTRTNWARRPLSHGQLNYAAEDVLYLLDIRAQLEEKLREMGRLEWLEEECRSLLDLRHYDPAFDKAWRRCKLRSRLTPKERGAWRALCELRERKASEFDRPRRWVLEDTALEELAVLRPDEETHIRRLLRGGRTRRQLDFDDVRDVLSHAEPVQDDRPGRPEAEELAQIDACLARVRATAKELTLSATLLATRKDIGQLVRGDRDLALLRGWRKTVIGDDLLEQLASR